MKYLKPTEAMVKERETSRNQTIYKNNDKPYVVLRSGNVVLATEDRHKALRYIEENHEGGFIHAMDNGWGFIINGKLANGTN